MKYPFEIRIDKFLKPGENRIRIEVANLLINHYLDPAFKIRQYEGIMEEWPYFSSVINNHRHRRIGNWRELKMAEDVFPSGLSEGAWLQFTSG